MGWTRLLVNLVGVSRKKVDVAIAMSTNVAERSGCPPFLAEFVDPDRGKSGLPAEHC